MTFLSPDKSVAETFAGLTFEPRGDGSYWAVSADGFAVGVVTAAEAQAEREYVDRRTVAGGKGVSR